MIQEAVGSKSPLESCKTSKTREHLLHLITGWRHLTHSSSLYSYTYVLLTVFNIVWTCPLTYTIHPDHSQNDLPANNVISLPHSLLWKPYDVNQKVTTNLL